MPVLYKPKFCCDCGEAIERADWTIWTSRRFCTVCASVQKQYDLIPRTVVVVGIFFGILGISSLAGGSRKEAVRSVPLASSKLGAPPARSGETAELKKQMPGPSSVPQPTPTRLEGNQTPPTNTTAPRQIAEPEAAYFCGAATKKGTPCSRRVKAPGRCWQHVGQPAMVADTRIRSLK